jgi:hypothetical protein
LIDRAKGKKRYFEGQRIVDLKRRCCLMTHPDGVRFGRR